MTKVFFLLFFTFLSKTLFADGIPVDSNGKITVPYITVSITLEQQEYLEYNRELTLTNSQQKIVRNLWPFEKIDVLDAHHNDCTCGLIYAIWITPSTIAFLGDTAVTSIENEDWFDEFKIELQESESYIENKNNYLYIGVKGDIYYMDKIISIKEVARLIEDLSSKKQKSFLVIYTAPKMDNEDWDLIEEAKKKILQSSKEDFALHWM